MVVHTHASKICNRMPKNNTICHKTINLPPPPYTFYILLVPMSVLGLTSNQKYIDVIRNYM